MSSPVQPDQECWEYRHQRFEPNGSDPQAYDFQEQDPKFIEWLVETLESVEQEAEGWRMVSAKIESDERGRLRINVLMKRPLVDSKNSCGSSSIPHAA
jgi:hypothetical protein